MKFQTPGDLFVAQQGAVGDDPHVVLAQTLPQRPTTATLDDEHGRGLQLVSLLTERWGTRATATGKAIWCVGPMPEPVPVYENAAPGG